MNTIFSEWTPDLTRQFREGVMIAPHRLHEHPLFTDEALEALLESHPRELKMVYAMPEKQGSEKAFREGDLSGRSGADIMEAVRKGRLWVQLLRLNKANDAFARLEQEIIAEMKQNIPGFKALQCKLSLLISSPNINVSYHADIPRNALWHIRGEKRVFIYPASAPFLSDEMLEGVYLGETQEAIPFDPSFDEKALVVDMKPGDVATWPVNAPHRVENGNCLNVSLVMEYFQPHVIMKYGVCYTNGYFRRRFNRPLKINNLHSPVAALKLATGIVLRTMKQKRGSRRERFLSFAVDPAAPGGMVDIPMKVRGY